MQNHITLTFALAFTLACATNEPAGDSETDTESDAETGDSPIGLVCDPSIDTACGSAGGLCCSDDPAAFRWDDLEAQATPQYQGGGGEGTTLFSGGNNPLSRRGLCVDPTTVSPSLALDEVNAQGCPIPCNPRWSAPDINEVCGSGSVCCQTIELEPADCVLDPNLGDNGCFRPITGNDITGLGGLDATNWSLMDHATHQDPSGLSCNLFASNIPAEVLDDFGLTDEDMLLACFRRLGVADIRGFCSPGASPCPLADPNYIDACEQLSLDSGLTGC